MRLLLHLKKAYTYKHKNVLQFQIHHHVLQSLTDVVAFDGAEHAEGLN